MAVWDKGFYAPATGVWHEILAAAADSKMAFCQVANISPTESARVIVAVGASDDTPILAPAGLSLQESGAIGTTAYDYVVTAVKSDGRETEASAKISVTSGANTLDTDNYHTLSWNTVTGAAKYRLYCRVGGADSAILKVVETTALSYANKGAMSEAEKWPWVNMTGVVALLAWCDLAPGCGVEPISRPIPVKTGTKIMLYTTGAVSAFASGEV